MKTQKELVLEFIKNAGSITAKEAFTELGITRLSARIFDLRKAGEPIVQERKYYTARDGRSKHYDVFFLGDKE